MLHRPAGGIEPTLFVEIMFFAISSQMLKDAMDLFRHGYSGYGMDFGLTLLLLRTRQSGALVHDVQMFHPKRREAETVRADPNFVERNREILAYIYETFGSDLRIETVFDSMRYFRRVTRQSLRLTKWLNRPLRVLYGHR